MLPSIGLSKRKRLPVFRFGDFTYALWDVRFLRFFLSVKDRERGYDPALGDVYTTKMPEATMKLHAYYANLVMKEGNRWESCYLPSFPLHGKTVLDVGAGDGETAYFFLRHGAKRVICVESNPECVRILKENVRMNSWNVDVLEGVFQVSMLERLEFDFLKMDIEGGEEELLKLERLPSACVMEVHSEELASELLRRFDLKPVFTGSGVAILASHAKGA